MSLIEDCKKEDCSALIKDALNIIKQLQNKNEYNNEIIKGLCLIIKEENNREEKLFEFIKEKLFSKRYKHDFQG